MKIWAKVTFKDGNQIQRLSLKVEGKGEEAELELALSEGTQDILLENVNPQALQPETHSEPEAETAEELQPEPESQAEETVVSEPEAIVEVAEPPAQAKVKTAAED